MAFKDLIAGKKKQQEEDSKDSTAEERTLGIFPEEILKNLRSDLKGYVGLLPKLEEMKDFMVREVQKLESEFAEIEEQLTRLTVKNKQLEEDIEKKENEISAIDNINGILSVVSAS